MNIHLMGTGCLRNEGTISAISPRFFEVFVLSLYFFAITFNRHKQINLKNREIHPAVLSEDIRQKKVLPLEV